MKKVELEIIALSISATQLNNYVVLLGEAEGRKKFPIVIGSFEAQSIAVALENIKPKRPLTHDLFKNVMTTFDIELVEVVIYKFEDICFYSKLICMKDGETVEIDSRTSDALALSLRIGCPIFIYESILENVAVIDESIDEDLDFVESDDDKEIEDHDLDEYSLKPMTLEALNELLQQALEKEDYNLAIAIRDELKNRGKA